MSDVFKCKNCNQVCLGHVGGDPIEGSVVGLVSCETAVIDVVHGT